MNKLTYILINLSFIFALPAGDMNAVNEVLKPIVGDMSMNQAAPGAPASQQPLAPSTSPVSPPFIPQPPYNDGNTNIDIVNTVIVENCRRGGKCGKKHKKHHDYDDYDNYDNYNDYDNHDDYDNYDDYN